MIYTLDQHSVKTVGDNFYIAPNATVLGQVELGENASVWFGAVVRGCLLYTSPSPRDLSTSRMPSSA